jgi:hypothetical protein
VRARDVTVESDGGIAQGLVDTCRRTLNYEITGALKEHFEDFKKTKSSLGKIKSAQ